SLRKLNLDILLFADLALDPYTSHGQDGVVLENGYVDNDKTVEILAKASIICADAGFDWVAPSDMMDGRVGAIRSILDQNSFSRTGIISYSAKFASSYYGPFRTAINSTTVGKPVNKKSYQLNPSNFKEAKRELWLDFEEGADMLMIKPAEPYLDVISYANRNFNLPVAAYQVSGEYSRIMAAGQLGWLDWKSCALESLVGIKRAGADLIFTYFADRLAPEL
ncbi:MAG: porphobilinogen synthase, partial [Opitutae bacterium]